MQPLLAPIFGKTTDYCNLVLSRALQLHDKAAWMSHNSALLRLVLLFGSRVSEVISSLFDPVSLGRRISFMFKFKCLNETKCYKTWLNVRDVLCHFGKDILIRRKRSSSTFFFFFCLNKLNNQIDLKDNKTSNCLTLFICGGPCHLSSFKQCSGTLFSSENSLFIQLWGKQTFLSLYHYFIKFVNIKTKTTKSPFKPHI